MGIRRASLVVQTVKNLPGTQESWVQPLGQEDPLEKGMATHSNILAWRIHGQWSLASYSPWGHSHFKNFFVFSLFFPNWNHL